MRYKKAGEMEIVQEEAKAGLRSMENLIFQLSSSHQHHHQQMDCREITDFTVSKFKKVISILDRTGHARFRRAPPSTTLPPPMLKKKATTQMVTLDFTKPEPVKEGSNKNVNTNMVGGYSKPVSSSPTATSSFLGSSSITGDASVSNGKLGGGSSLFIPAGSAPAGSLGKPPLSSPFKKRCHNQVHSDAGSGVRCHCNKRRY